MERTQTRFESEAFSSNVPKLILVFDNYRGPKGEKIAEETMEVRSAVAALIYHSQLYKDHSQRPIICSFAAEHEPYGIPGSEKVSYYLTKFAVPDDKILTRRNTITTITDMYQLHSVMHSRGINNAVIVTTNDHVTRTELEVENHFGRGRKHGKMPSIKVASPFSEFLSVLQITGTVDENTKERIMERVGFGQTKLLDGGIMERLAGAVSWIPHRDLRILLQNLSTRVVYPYTPVELERIYKGAKRMKNAGKK